MSQSMVVFDSLAHSNIPRHQKSVIAKYFDTLTGGRASQALSGFSGIRGHHVEASGHLIRSSTESLLVGGVLGAAHAEFGLDHLVPMDLVLSLLAMGASVGLSKSDVSSDFRIMGASALSVFSFRMGYKLMAEKAIAKGKQPAGVFVGASKMSGESDWGADSDMGADALVEAAKGL